MSRKAVNIDLSTFFDDERKCCYILLDPNWKSVACLQERLQHLFDIDCVRLLNNGCFLPPQESIEIVQFCNDIKAFVPKESRKKEKKSKKTKKLQNSSEEYVNEETGFVDCDQKLMHGKKKKRKCNSLSSSYSLKSYASQAKISKVTDNIDNFEHKEDSHNESGNKNSKSKSTDLVKTSYNTESTLRNHLHKEKSENNENSSNLPQYTSTPVARKYEIQPTSKPKVNHSSEITPNEEEKTSCRSKILSSILVNEIKILEHKTLKSPQPNNPFRKSKSGEAHIYFNETGEIISPKIKTKLAENKVSNDSKTIVIFRSALCEISNATQRQKPRVFDLKPLRKNLAKKPMIDIQENIILPPLAISNVTNDVSLEKELNNTNDIDKQYETKPSTEIMSNTDTLIENSSPHSSTIVRDSTTLAKSDNEEVSVNTLNVANVTVDQKMQLHRTNVNKTSMMTENYVDLSMELEDDNSLLQKTETEVTSNGNASKNHNLTTNGESIADRSSESDIEEISEIIDLNETEDNTNVTECNVSQNSTPCKKLCVEQILKYATELTDLPNVEDIVVFKIPYRNNSKKFTTTDFIAGKVEYVHKRAKTMKILVFDGNLDLCYIPNQFQYNLDTSQDEVKYLKLKLSDMIDPKRFSMR